MGDGIDDLVGGVEMFAVVVAPCYGDGFHVCVGGGFEIHGGVADDDALPGWDAECGCDFESASGVWLVGDVIVFS